MLSRHRIRCLPILVLSAHLLSASSAPSEPPASPTVVVGMALDGLWDRNDQIIDLFQTEIGDLLEGEFSVVFPPELILVSDFTLADIERSLDQLLADPSVDILIALGPLASTAAVIRGPQPKPVVAPFVVDLWLSGLTMKEGASGIRNLTYLVVPALVQRDLRMFREIVPFRRLVILETGAFAQMALHDHGPDAAFREETGITDVTTLYVFDSADDVLAQIPADAGAVYLAPLMTLSNREFDRLTAGLIERRLPSFSMLGRMDVERGVLAGLATDALIDRRARRTALIVQQILLGTPPESIPVAIATEQRLSLNMATARAIGVSPRWEIINEADLINEARRDIDRRLTLGGAMREAVQANLDLEAQRIATAAGRENVGEARGTLLPQVELGALASFIDEDRAEASFGQAAERTYSGSAGFSQVLFAEPALANLSVQKHLQRGRENELETLRLDVAETTALAYLNVLAAGAVEQIEKDNLKLTRENLALARVRSAIGTGGPAEVYRWEAEIAQRRRGVIEANSKRNLAEIELNRLLHQPLEAPFLPEEAGLDDPELILGMAPPFVYVDNRQNFKLLRDFLSGEALRLSPELRRLDAAIAAQERYSKSQNRQFYAPSVALVGSVENIFDRQGAGSGGGFDFEGLPPEYAPIAGLFPEPADDLNWQVGLSVGLPLFKGGSRRATQNRARRELDLVRLQRAAAAERIEQRVRSALHASGASYAAIRLTGEAADAAARTLDVVTDAYARGAVSILELLDAQNAALVTEVAAAIAVYEFLADYTRVQRAVGRFDAFSSEEEKRDRIDRLEGYILEGGGSLPGR